MGEALTIKLFRGMYLAGIILSLLVGIWHFFVPILFHWYSYIPQEYQNLIVGINYTNLCFSLLLSGISFILLIWDKKVFAGNKEAMTIYSFLILVWLLRAALTVLEPWPLEPIAWAAYLQAAVTAFILILLVIPYIKVCLLKDDNGRKI